MEVECDRIAAVTEKLGQLEAARPKAFKVVASKKDYLNQADKNAAGRM